MSATSDKAKRALNILSTLHNIDTLIGNIRNKSENAGNSESLYSELNVTSEGINSRIEFLLNKSKKGIRISLRKKTFY